MGVYDPCGHFVGQVTLRRLQQLEQRFLIHQQHTHQLETRSNKMPPEAAYELLVAHGVHRAQARSDPTLKRMHRWVPSDNIFAALHSVVPFDQEFFFLFSSGVASMRDICEPHSARHQLWRPD